MIHVYLLPAILLAQPPIKTLTHLTIQDGLTSDGVYCLLIDARGFLWVGTSSGLNRFDGVSIMNFRSEPGKSTTICHDWINTLANDDKGNIWVGTRNGICVINPYSLEVRQVKNDHTKTPIYSYKFFKDRDQKLWVTTSKGIYKCNLENWILQKIPFKKVAPTMSDIRCAAFTADHEIVFVLQDHFVKYNPTTHQIQETKLSIPNLKDLEVNNMIPIGKSKVLISTNSQISFIYDYQEQKGKAENKIGGISDFFFENDRSIIYCSSLDGGVMKLNGNTGASLKLIDPSQLLKYKDKAGLNRIVKVDEDRYWLGSGMGVFLVSTKPSKIIFHSFEKVFKGRGKKELGSFQFLDKGRDHLAASLIDSGYAMINLRTGQNITLPIPAQIHTNGFSNRAFLKDIQGGAVVCSTPNGLYEFNATLNKATSWQHKYRDTIFRKAFSFYENKHEIILSGLDGLYRWNKATRKASAIFIQGNRQDAPLVFKKFVEDRKGNIWCCPVELSRTIYIGVLSPGADTIRNFVTNESRTLDYYLNDPVVDICSYDGSKIWAATNRGLMYWDANYNNPPLNWVKEKQGLLSDKVLSLCSPTPDLIWCTTMNGVSVYHIPGGEIYNITNINGLQRNHSHFIDKFTDSSVGVTTWNGIDEIPYSILPTLDKSPQPVISTLKVNGNLVPFTIENTMGNKSIILSHRQNNFAFGVGQLNMSYDKILGYQYRLVGLDPTWRTSRSSELIIANLSPGDYMLELAPLQFRVDKGKIQHIYLYIQKPFWQTIWFGLLCLVVAALILNGILQQRIKQIKEKYRLRNKIAADLHDEVGSTLTSINILSNVLRHAIEKEPGQAKEMLEKIFQQSKAMQQNMSDIVWAIRGDNDKIERLLVRMREYAAETLEPLRIETNINSMELSETHLTPEIKKELLLIYKEAVNNVAKHAEATSVSIQFQKLNNMLQLVIADNGHWSDSGRTSGTGLSSMQQRAASLGGTLDIIRDAEGTTLKVSIPFTRLGD